MLCEGQTACLCVCVFLWVIVTLNGGGLVEWETFILKVCPRHLFITSQCLQQSKEQICSTARTSCNFVLSVCYVILGPGHCYQSMGKGMLVFMRFIKARWVSWLLGEAYVLAV